MCAEWFNQESKSEELRLTSVFQAIYFAYRTAQQAFVFNLTNFDG